MVCFHSCVFDLIRYYSEHAESPNFTLVFKCQAIKPYNKLITFKFCLCFSLLFLITRGFNGEFCFGFGFVVFLTACLFDF